MYLQALVVTTESIQRTLAANPASTLKVRSQHIFWMSSASSLYHFGVLDIVNTQPLLHITSCYYFFFTVQGPIDRVMAYLTAGTAHAAPVVALPSSTELQPAPLSQ